MLARRLEARPARPTPNAAAQRRPRMAPRADAAAATPGDAASAKQQRRGVLFVCLGNICRSPTAEAVFRAVVERRGLADGFQVDSCGTGGGASNVSVCPGNASGAGASAKPRRSPHTSPPHPHTKKNTKHNSGTSPAASATTRATRPTRA